MKTEEILEKIEKLEDWEETYNFISSLDLTPEQMELLTDHENWRVRIGLAENPNLTEEVMILLSSDKNDNVREGLALNPNLTEKVMVNLGSDENWRVRRGLAWNDNLTEELMIKLSSDEDYYARDEAFEKLKNLNSLKSDDLESAYDLIRESKYISRENFEKTFNYIVNKFPELNKLAEMLKRIILKGKKGLK